MNFVHLCEKLYVKLLSYAFYLPYADENDEELKNTLKINLLSAMHTALLLLPESFSEEQLYLTLTGLSYMGMHEYVFSVASPHL